MKNFLTTLGFLFLAAMPYNMTAKVVQQQNVKVGDLVYNLYNDGTATIVKDNSYSSIKELVIPATIEYDAQTFTVDSIGAKAFNDSKSKIESIQFSNKLRFIGMQAFRDCRNLTSLTLPGTIESFDKEVFMYCTHLNRVVIKEGIDSLSVGMFRGCSNLEEIIVAESVRVINANAFSGCNSIKKFFCLTFNVNTYSNAFDGVNLANSQLFTYKFMDTSKFPWYQFGKKIYIDNLDYYVDGLYYNVINDYEAEVSTDLENEYNQYIGRSKDIKYTASSYDIPSTVYIEELSKTYIVTRVGENAFKNHENITAISFSSNMTVIGESAFEGCTKLASISLPNTVNTIGIAAFKNCSAMTSLKLPNNNDVVISDEAFSGCSLLSSLTLPDGLNTLGESAFADCKKIPSVVIPNGITDLENRVFFGCTGLTSVTLHGDINCIGVSAFAYCQNLPEITIPQGIVTLSNQAFRDCKKLTTIVLPESVDSIGVETFMYCSGLTKVTLSDNIKTIGNGAFKSCSGITAMLLPTKLKTLGGNAFEGCTNMSAITIFEQVKGIGDYAFKSCSSLKDIYCKPVTAPSAKKTTFDNSTYTKATLYLEANNDGSYNSHEAWGSFTKRSILGTHDLTYYVDGEIQEPVEHIATGTAITPRTEPTKEGRRFSGWSAIPELMPDSNVVVNGGFEYTVTFKVEGNEYAVSKFFYNDSIKTPASDRNGFHLEWTDLPIKMPANDFTVTGAYVPNIYKLTYLLQGAGYTDHKLKQIDVTYQDDLPADPTAPEKEGYAFAWETHLKKMPARDYSINGYYTPQVVENSITYNIYPEQNYALLYKNNANTAAVEIPAQVNHLGNSYPVTIIGKQAFRDSKKLTSIVIPESIDSIADEAFMYCTALTDVYCKRNETPKASLTAFTGTKYTESITLHIPNGAENAYKAVEPWKSFFKITEGIKYSTLTYYLDGELYKTKENIMQGAPVTPEPAPEKEEREFSGWKGEPAVMPDSNVTVNGAFKYTVTFKVEGKEDVIAKFFNGDKMTLPPSERTGYHIKWEGLPTDSIFRGKDDNTVYTGTYEPNKYKLTYMLHGAGYTDFIMKQDSVAYDTDIPADPAAPEKEGFAFAWEKHTAKMPARDLTVNGYYTPQVVENNITYVIYQEQNYALLYKNNANTAAVEIPVQVNHLGNSYPVTIIGKQAFRDSKKLTSIVIPESIDSIADEAFMYCTALTDVYCKRNETPKASLTAFTGTKYTESITLHIPNGAENAYKAVEPWKSFFKITEGIKYSTLTYYLDGELYKTKENIMQGAPVTPEPAPEKEEREFSGWKGEPAVMPDSNVTVNGAFKYIVTFKFESEEPQMQGFFCGERITLPKVEQREGYTARWEGLPKDTVMTAQDIEVKGSYRPNPYVVTYVIDGQEVKKDTIDYGAAITPPEVKERYGYTFQWEEFPATMPAKDITVKGSYTQRIEDAQQDNLNYRIHMGEGFAEVIAKTDGNYEGSITIDSQVTYDNHTFPVWGIAASAFSGCTKLTAVTLPETIRYIGKQAFRDCGKITNIVLPARTDSIADEAFMYCSALTQITLSENLKTIGNSAFKGCTEIQEIYCNAVKAPKASANSFEETTYGKAWLYLPAHQDGSYDSHEVWKMFTQRKALNRYNLTYYVDGEVDGTVETYTTGEAITPRPEPTKEGHRFSGWSKIPEVMPDSNVTVKGAFEYIVTFKVEGKEDVIAKFFNGDKMTLPPSERTGYHIKWEGLPTDSIFRGKDDNTVYTGTYEPNKYKLTYMLHGAGYTDFIMKQDSVAYDTDIPADPAAPEKEGFAFAWEKHTAKMPARDYTINGYYTPQVVENSITYVIYQEQNYALLYKNNANTAAVEIPAQVNHLGNSYPVTIIGKQAFRDSKKLTSIVIPESIDSIADEAFMYCTALTDVYCKRNETPKASLTAFTGTKYTESITLHIPNGAENAYKAVEPWKSFFKITEGIKYSTLTYYLDGELYKTKENIMQGAPVTPEPAPEKEEREFSGWKGEPAVMPDSNVTVNGAFKYIVTFKFESEEPQMQGFFCGERITLPKVEQREGYTARWEGLPKDTVMTAQDIEVKGSYRPNPYVVTYVIDGQEVKKDTIDYGAAITPPEVKERYGYTFQWEEFPATMPAKDITVKGSYTQRIEDAQQDNLNYRIHMGEGFAEVIAKTDGNYEGSITIDSQVTYDNHTFPVWGIAASAFSGCTKLTAVTLPETIRYIGKQAFRDCGKITNIVLPARTDSIADEAFMYCSALTQITLSENLKTIGNSAFKKCTALNHVYSHATIAPKTPYGNPFSESAYLTLTVLHVPSAALNSYRNATYWKDFYEITDIKFSTLTYYVDGEVFRTFKNIKELTPITPQAAPNNEDREFSGWSEIPEVMPDHDVNVYGSFRYVITYRFEQMDPIQMSFFSGEDIKLPEIDKKEGHHVEWTGLPEDMVMPGSDLTVWGKYVPSQYVITYMVEDELYTTQTVDYGSTITPPNDVPERYAYVFEWEKYPATMPARDITINGYYKQRIVDQTTDGVTYRIYMIEDRAEVVQHATNTNGKYIGNITVNNEVVFEDHTYVVSSVAANAFSGSEELTNVTLPTTINTIGKQAFRDCKKIQVINLPEGLQNIEDEAFLYCSSLKDVYLPQTLQTIGSKSFGKCTNLQTVTCRCTEVPVTNVTAFADVNLKSAVLFVPSASIKEYKQVAPWSGFGFYLPITDTSISVIHMVGGQSATYYTLDGQRVEQLLKGQTYIERTPDGRTRKIHIK